MLQLYRITVTPHSCFSNIVSQSYHTCATVMSSHRHTYSLMLKSHYTCAIVMSSQSHHSCATVMSSHRHTHSLMSQSHHTYAAVISLQAHLRSDVKFASRMLTHALLVVCHVTVAQRLCCHATVIPHMYSVISRFTTLVYLTCVTVVLSFHSCIESCTRTACCCFVSSQKS